MQKIYEETQTVMSWCDPFISARLAKSKVEESRLFSMSVQKFYAQQNLEYEQERQIAKMQAMFEDVLDELVDRYFYDENEQIELPPIMNCKLDELRVLPRRETHPFDTYVPLNGGVKNYKKKGKKPRGYPVNRIERSKASGNVGVVVPRGTGPLPLTSTTTLKYVEIVTMTNAAGVAQNYAFNANSCFDPNRTGTGHQPEAFDTWALIDNRYLVNACTAKVVIPTSNDANHICCFFTNTIQGSVTTKADFEDCSEKAFAFTGVLSYGGGPPFKYKRKIVNSKLNGAINHRYFVDDGYSATFTSSPTENQTFNIAVYNSGGVSVSISIQVTLLFDIQVFDSIPQGLSFSKKDRAQHYLDYLVFVEEYFKKKALLLTEVPQEPSALLVKLSLK